MKPWILIIVGLWLTSGSAFGQTAISPWLDEAIVCPANDEDVGPPDFTAPDCKRMVFRDVAPQDQHIWVKVWVNLSSNIQDQKPLSVFLTVQASSVVYLNGNKLGENGRPSSKKSTEIAGKLDSDYFIPSRLVHSGRNEIVLRMSSHNGFLNAHPHVHLTVADRFQNGQDYKLRKYWPTLLPFGALVLGGLYFVIMALRGRHFWPAVLLSLMSFASATQLLTEVSRGLFAFSYPMQDLRLMGIWICAAIFSTSLGAYGIDQFQSRHKVLLVVITVCLAIMSLGVSGTDSKASFAFLLPTVFAAALSFYHGVKGNRQAWWFGAALTAFAAVNIFTSGGFLDLYFYYIVLALLLFLFAHQAAAFAREQGLLIKEAERSERLQMALDSKRTETEEFTITVTSAGKIRHINIREIAHIDGADDYSKIVLATGKTFLHSDTLSDLEKSLPHQFLRVHRSHIVNTDFIEILTREPSGTGSLKLNNGDLVPVSRRIMPGVRQALS